MELIGVQSSDIDKVWEKVEPWIKSACKTTHGRIDSEDVKRFLSNKEWQLWLAYDGEIKAVCCTEILNYAKMKVCRVCIVTGKGRAAWQHFRFSIEEWARVQGCERIEALARKGWARIFGDYKETHRFLEKQL